MDADPSQADLVASLKKHAEVLAAAASMDVNGAAPTDMDAAVREMLSRSSELLRGAASLGNDGNPIALEVIARALLENMITILWVQVDAAHPQHLKNAAVAELTRMIRVNLKAGNARVMNRETGADSTAEFLASDGFKNLPRRMSVEDRAKQAGVEDLYNIFYRSLSMGVHGHSLEGGDTSLELTVMHMQGVGAIALATGHSGVRWLVHRERTDNETLRKLLGLGGEL
ncbi:DUF5677 domain-containing protein [Aromatoleum toluclasticum]|uniref:DUF5677 domain-containing protein n=1 Tax=Aromatoleum toluclasticum TaxID=92003 RepID=UPI001D198503|nr:DUF5677 domain-containing protein [Aromatoleum toluclasticum]MCC4118644.1 DUF5677 domain-containing protein [Aromatoleum toluclasticum]